MLLAEHLVPPAVVPADREVRDPKCAPHTKWGRAGGRLSWGNLHSSYPSFQGHLLPLTSVCVCRIWPPAPPPLLQWQPGNGEEIWTEIRGDREPNYQFPPKRCPPHVLDEPCSCSSLALGTKGCRLGADLLPSNPKIQRHATPSPGDSQTPDQSGCGGLTCTASGSEGSMTAAWPEPVSMTR